MNKAEVQQRFSNGVYIYAPDQVLTHFTGCLIEGILDLDIPFKTNAEKVTSRPASMPLAEMDLEKHNSEPVSGFDAYLIDISTDNTYIPMQGVGSALIGYITTSDVSAFCTIKKDFVLFAAHDSAMP